MAQQEQHHRNRRCHPAACRTLITTLIIAAGLGGPLSQTASAAERTEEQKRVDESIVSALKFLDKQQEPSGAWRIRSYGESTAATSMAVMAFLAAGHVPGEGPYGKHLERAIDWVLDHQQEMDRREGKETVMLVARRSHGPMYSHGVSTLMLAEVVGMLTGKRAKRCREALEKSVRLIIKAQNVRKSSRHVGGWRYQASSRDSDLSVTGWQLLALRAAKNVGCDVPKESIDRAVAYVNDCRPRSRSGFSYQPGGGSTPTRTGTGILCLAVCGAHKSQQGKQVILKPEARDAANYLLSRPLRYRDHYFYYGVYYCTVGMFKMGDQPDGKQYWSETKANNFRILLDEQNGDGSWLSHRGERRHGRIYCTCMAVLALAVEYQYLPIYQR